MASENQRRVAEPSLKMQRALAVVATFAGLASGCFAIFGLDGYGPAATAEEGGTEDGAVKDAAPVETGPVDAGPRPKVVFVTSQQFAVGAADGIEATVASGHDRCNELAKKAGLTGTFKAWLSTEEASPSTEFAALRSDGGDVFPLATPTGVLVAASYAELADSGPRIAIAVTESKSTLADASAGGGEQWCNPSVVVWTATSRTGTRDDQRPNCFDWRASGSAQTARVGRIVKDPTEWTSACELPCNQRARLYCFEQ